MVDVVVSIVDGNATVLQFINIECETEWFDEFKEYIEGEQFTNENGIHLLHMYWYSCEEEETGGYEFEHVCKLYDFESGDVESVNSKIEEFKDLTQAEFEEKNMCDCLIGVGYSSTEEINYHLSYAVFWRNWIDEAIESNVKFFDYCPFCKLNLMRSPWKKKLNKE